MAVWYTVVQSVWLVPQNTRSPADSAFRRDRLTGRVVLVVGDAGEADADALPSGQRQARAVVTHRPVAAPDVGLAELGEGEEDGPVPGGGRREQQRFGRGRADGVAEGVRRAVLLLHPVAVARRGRDDPFGRVEAGPPAAEPAKAASPKLKMPPSAATIQ